uniref:Uncharacterized protein n=1 Tax=Amphora coffeiformis TaxID=265554 RepID=A0A7S3P3U2_9STRA|mmetsp:Transcript_9714/g.18767  ORF Transcript_9714/g.18767 Transcript_9714/m.18767 type:complete len:385 (+) Transcript_9714:36-1190(+)
MANNVDVRKPRNYPLLLVSCLILMLACWNFLQAEEEFYGRDLWDDAASMMATPWELPNLTTYTTWDSNTSGESIGVIILGMHRSGTSMLAGLLATAYGYFPGETEELIPPRYANAKGYFERVDIVRQNDRFMQQARLSMPMFHSNILFTPWVITQYEDYYTTPYDMLNATMSEDVTTALNFMNNEHPIVHTDHPTIPWVQKDPRMCVTLRTWLPFLKQPPAVIITYRHPAEVGHSVATRDHKPMLIGLNAWIAYNTAIIRNSMGLCTVVTNNANLLYSPGEELRRIVDELQTKCNVVAPPIPVPDPKVVDDFIDVKMQGSRHKELTPCVEGVPYFNVTTSGLKPSSKEVYRRAMKMYCDMESGIAFKPGYTGFAKPVKRRAEYH